MKFVIGIDVGGTTAKFGYFTPEGQLLKKSRIPTGNHTQPEQLFKQMADHIKEEIGGEGWKEEELLGIGLGIPGPVTDMRLLYRAVNMGWSKVDVVDHLSQYFSCPIRLENDANVAALGELWQGAGRGRQSMVLLTLGTGIGGGIVLNGKIWSGSHGSAGEVGHAAVLSQDVERTCGCGKHNCLELISSATGYVGRMKEKLAQSDEPSVLRGEEFDCLRIFQAAARGDKLAGEVVDYGTETLGRSLAILAAILDPEVLVLGGAVANSDDQLFDPVIQSYRHYAFSANVDTPIIKAELGNDAGMVGAAKLVIG